MGIPIKSMVVMSERGGKILLECDKEQFEILQHLDRLQYFTKTAKMDGVRGDEIIRVFGKSLCGDSSSLPCVLRLKKIDSAPDAIEFEIKVRSRQITREDESGHEPIFWYAIRSEKWRIKGSEFDMVAKSEWKFSDGSVELPRP
jgi:hypothetical protein